MNREQFSRNAVFVVGLIGIYCALSLFADEPDSAAKSQEMIEGLSSIAEPISFEDSGRDFLILSGEYSNPGASWGQRSLSGSELYLFPDATYIYIEWADILPPTIYEKGAWDFRSGFVNLIRDGSLSESRGSREHQFLPFHLKNKASETFLMGNDWSYSYFLETVSENSQLAEHMIPIISFERDNEITDNENESLKAQLMQESWKPWFFREGFPPHSLKEEAYTGSDVVAVVQTISGESLPEGGIRVKVKVLLPIKGTKNGEILDVYYGAGNLQQRYIAALVWDSELKGYQFYDPNIDYPVIEIERSEYGETIQEIMSHWGLEGEPVPFEVNKYYLPICRVEFDNVCQRKFEFVQYMLSKIR